MLTDVSTTTGDRSSIRLYLLERGGRGRWRTGGPGGRGTGHLVVPEKPTCPIRLRRRSPQPPILATRFSALAAEIRQLGGWRGRWRRGGGGCINGGEAWLCVRDGCVLLFLHFLQKEKHILSRISWDESVGVPHPHLTLLLPGSKGGVYNSLLTTCPIRGERTSFQEDPPPSPIHHFTLFQRDGGRKVAERRVEPEWSLKEEKG